MAWKALNEKIEGYQEINFVLSTENIQELVKDNKNKSFVLKEVSEELPPEGKFPEKFKENSIWSSLSSKIYFLKKTPTPFDPSFTWIPEIVNTAQRKDFIFDVFIPLIKTMKKRMTPTFGFLECPISGRQCAKHVDEIGLLVLGAALITTLIFFLFFRSFPSHIHLPLLVAIGVMWAFGILGWLGYEITVLTALIPPL